MQREMKIGVLGGGQLGAMLIRSAIDFGVEIYILDKDPKAPAAHYCSGFVIGDPLSYNDVVDFGCDMDAITIEKEAVDTQALKELQKRGVKIFPSPDNIEIIQNKFIQKKFLQNNDIPVVPAIATWGVADIIANKHRLPGCLKLCTQGYDGRGVMILKDEQDALTAFEAPSLLEELVDIKHELSVIVCRNEKGDIECYDPVMMIVNKERHVLDFQLCPAQINRAISLQARETAIRVAEAFNLVGIMAVELFVTTDDEVLVNEIAPRPHNSGHHTIEACATSQFEQLLRIIMGLPLGDARHIAASVMINILEPSREAKTDIMAALRHILCFNGVYVHWYGKHKGKKGRKMGHITITENNIENALSKAANIRHILTNIYERSEGRNNNG